MIISVSFLHLDLISLATRAINVSMDNLKTLTTKELQSKWQEIFKIPAPKGYTKSFLIKEIEWYYKYRKLSGELQKRLDKLVEHYSETKTIDTKKIKLAALVSVYVQCTLIWKYIKCMRILTTRILFACCHVISTIFGMKLTAR